MLLYCSHSIRYQLFFIPALIDSERAAQRGRSFVGKQTELTLTAVAGWHDARRPANVGTPSWLVRQRCQFCAAQAAGSSVPSRCKPL